MSTYSNGSNFFSHNSSSKVLLANNPNCDTNEPPFVLGGSFCAKGVQPKKLLRMKSGKSSLRFSAYL